MNIAFRNVLTVPEYLAWAQAQPEKLRAELINGQIVPRASERAIHNRLKLRCYQALAEALKTSQLSGEVFIDGMAVPIDPYTAYEPDVVLYLGPRLPDAELVVTTPCVVVEVLSPTTSHTDRTAKLAGYFTLSSVQHHIVVDPDTMSLTHHHRGADGSLEASTPSGATLRLDPPGIELDLAAIFAG